MKKLLFICIVIVGIVFIAGCIGEEKTSTSGVAENSRSSGILLNPSNLLNGYYSSNFQSYAISEAESFEIRPDFIEGSIRSTQNKFESEIPAGKKRVITYFDLYNEDATIGMRTGCPKSNFNESKTIKISTKN